MSDGTKFFNTRNLSNKNWYIKRALASTNNRVIHRDYGVIPGCVPAVMCIIETPLDEARKITDARASLWAASLLKYCDGGYGGNHGVEDMWRESKITSPLLGPYGERL